MLASPLAAATADRPDGGRPRVLTTSAAALPGYSPWLVRGFSFYVRRYLRRHFHSVRVCAGAPAPLVPAEQSIVFYVHHASWWDPLIGFFLRDQLFASRRLYAPIDAEALERYRMFRRLGFFGVRRGTAQGAREFLRTGVRVLQERGAVLAMTPQGRFADVRERPVRFAGGLGHLACRVPDACYVAVGIEYVYWEERLPEVLVAFGRPLTPGSELEVGAGGERDAARWTQTFAREMERTLERLAKRARGREPCDFEMLLKGGAGQGGIYDWWRRGRARLRGERFRKEHGA